MALKSNIDSETKKRALEEVLNLVQQTTERCLLAQAESIREAFSQGVNMERAMQGDDEKRGG